MSFLCDTHREGKWIFFFFLKDIFTQPDPIWMCLELFSDGYVIEFDSKFGKVLDFTNNLTQLLN